MTEGNFVDYVKVHVTSGKGGQGSAHLRREKFIPKGGPDGGDGGRGGHIILKANSNLWTLHHLKFKRHYKAGYGGAGSKQTSTGADGEDIYVEVPLGTVVINTETGERLKELLHHDDELILAKGGMGGLGNNHFKSSTNQTPRYAQPGMDGEEGAFTLEMKVLADVGLVGFPNAGKSTFLNKVSSAKPKIGSYPFTTLRPHLGTIEGADSSFVIADIPGLIEGASEGAGLGIKFLQHISRTGLLLIFVDLYSSDDLDPIDQIRLLKNELSAYKEDLTQKVSWVVCNKIDLINKEDRAEHSKDIQEALNISEQDIFFISAATGEGTQKLLQSLEAVISQSKLDLT